jgi:hypothetical protein
MDENTSKLQLADSFSDSMRPAQGFEFDMPDINRSIMSKDFWIKKIWCEKKKTKYLFDRKLLEYKLRSVIPNRDALKNYQGCRQILNQLPFNVIFITQCAVDGQF